jgi:hypothetical protein
MPVYSNNVILRFDSADPEDAALDDIAAALVDRYKSSKGLESEIAWIGSDVPADELAAYGRRLAEAGLGIGRKTRVYLVGHGHWQFMTLGGRSVDEVAAFLSAFPQLFWVNVLGCSLGREVDASGSALVGQSNSSFAGWLHYLLRYPHGIKAVVVARVRVVRAWTRSYLIGEGVTPGSAVFNEWLGRKAAELLDRDGPGQAGQLAHKLQHNKLAFFWENDRQVKKWAY